MRDLAVIRRLRLDILIYKFNLLHYLYLLLLDDRKSQGRSPFALPVVDPYRDGSIHLKLDRVKLLLRFILSNILRHFHPIGFVV